MITEKGFSINKKFKLNNKCFTKNQLISFCKNNFDENNEVYDFIIDWLSDKKTIKVQTSGSTGEPKTYSIKKNKMTASAKITGEFFNLKQGDRALLCIPVRYIAGKMMVVRSLVLGLDLIIQNPCDNPLGKQKFDFAALTVHQLSNSIENSDKVSCLIVGGSPVSESLKEKIFDKTSGIYETYGMTESLTHVAVRNLSIGEKEFNALPGINFRSKNGILKINASHISNKIIETNDMVKLISETKFIWLGRKDFIINSGGIKINPELVENKLIPFYSEKFIICGIPHEILGEQVVLVFENKIPSNHESFFDELGIYEKPKKVFCLKSFKYSNGKVQRRHIQNQIRNIKIFI